MEELKRNFQICYFHPQNARGQAAALMAFGFSQLPTTYIYQNRNNLKALCERVSSIVFFDITGFIQNHLIDCIKIHICYENFLKAIVLANGDVIHRLNKDIFPELAKKQFKEPIHIAEITQIAKWNENSKVELPTKELRMQITGIENHTLGINVLTKTNYINKMNLDKNILKILTPYLDYRNNLHYYSGESFSLDKSTFSNFIKLIDFANKNIVRIHNELLKLINKEKTYNLKPIEL